MVVEGGATAAFADVEKPKWAATDKVGVGVQHFAGTAAGPHDEGTDGGSRHLLALHLSQQPAKLVVGQRLRPLRVPRKDPRDLVVRVRECGCVRVREATAKMMAEQGNLEITKTKPTT